MGMRDYQVLLLPSVHSPLRESSSDAKKTLEDVDEVVSVLKAQWAEIHPDDKASYNPAQERALVYETDTELFQLLVSLYCDIKCVNISMRFAYCNPKSIYNPFCNVAEWLMSTYNLTCNPMRELGIDKDGGILKPYPIIHPETVRSVLVPSMEYMRGRWQQWVGSNMEAKLRPWEARLYFQDRGH